MKVQNSNLDFHFVQCTLMCIEPSLETYVDDNFVTITKMKHPRSNKNSNGQNLSIHYYANRLVLNKEKTQIMLITKDKNQLINFKNTLNNKVVKHQPRVKILGN